MDVFLGVGSKQKKIIKLEIALDQKSKLLKQKEKENSELKKKLEDLQMKKQSAHSTTQTDLHSETSNGKQWVGKKRLWSIFILFKCYEIIYHRKLLEFCICISF